MRDVFKICELGPIEAQAQNTSKNDDLENGPHFVFDFFVESTHIAWYHVPNKAGICLVLVVNFSEQPVEVRVQWYAYLFSCSLFTKDILIFFDYFPQLLFELFPS